MEIIIKTPELPAFPGAKFERKPHGAIIIGGDEVAHTLQCPHCGGHFVSIRGSGARRCWCTHCSAVTCGRPECDVCMPWEKQMEAMEKQAAIIVARGS